MTNSSCCRSRAPKPSQRNPLLVCHPAIARWRRSTRTITLPVAAIDHAWQHSPAIGGAIWAHIRSTLSRSASSSSNGPLEHTAYGRDSLSARMNVYREAWMRRLLDREARMVDMQIMAALQNGTAFFASTSLIAVGG